MISGSFHRSLIQLRPFLTHLPGLNMFERPSTHLQPHLPGAAPCCIVAAWGSMATSCCSEKLGWQIVTAENSCNHQDGHTEAHKDWIAKLESKSGKTCWYKHLLLYTYFFTILCLRLRFSWGKHNDNSMKDFCGIWMYLTKHWWFVIHWPRQLSAKALEAACALLRGRSLEEVSQEWLACRFLDHLQVQGPDR